MKLHRLISLPFTFVADVATLVKSVSVLEKHLPAAAYVAIKSAAVA